MQELMTQPAVSKRETYVSTRELPMKREFNAFEWLKPSDGKPQDCQQKRQQRC